MTAAPGLRLQSREWQAALEYLSARATSGVIDSWPRGDGHSVLVIPGYLGNEVTTRFLRATLRRPGHHADDWKAGRNLGTRNGLGTHLERRVYELAARSRGTVSVVGWSLGG